MPPRFDRWNPYRYVTETYSVLTIGNLKSRGFKLDAAAVIEATQAIFKMMEYRG